MKILLIVFGLALLTSGLHAQEEAALETAVKKTATTELQAIESRLVGRLAASASIIVGLYVGHSIESATLRVNVVGEVPQGIKVIRPDAPVTQPGLRLIINEIP